MQTDFDRLLVIQEALLSHARWLAGLQASPFAPPEMDADRASAEARALNPSTIPTWFCAEDFEAQDPLPVYLTENQINATRIAENVDAALGHMREWELRGLPGWRL